MFSRLQGWARTLIAVGRYDVDGSSATAAAPAAPESHRRFHCTMAAITLATTGFCLWGVPANRLAVPFPRLLPKLIVLLLLLAATLYYRRRGVTRLHNLSVMAFWTIAVTSLYVFPMYIAARRPVEFSDFELARADAALGIEVPEILSLVAGYPVLRTTLRVAYDTLIFLMMFAILLPPLFGRMDRAKEFALSCVTAAAISIPLLAFVQAVGPWQTYAFEPDANQRRYMNVLFALRSDQWVTIDPLAPEGLITFPSFHAILAIFTAVALWVIPYVRWIGATLALAIVISTLTTGWHYVVDVLAGLVLAAVAFGTARTFHWFEARAQSLATHISPE